MQYFRLMLGNTLIFLSKRSFIGRGTGRRIVLRLLRILGHNEFYARFRGIPMYFHLDNNTERKALLNDRYDHIELDFLTAHLRKPGAVFFDIGANCGLYTVFVASRMLNNSKVVSIEPNPVMIKRIRKNIHIFTDHKCNEHVNFLVEGCAIGKKTENLFLDTRNGFGRAFVSEEETESTITIPVRSLQNIFEKYNFASIDAMKIDVEGYEDRVLIPYFSSMSRSAYPKALVFEVNPNQWSEDLLSWCNKVGYKTLQRTRSSVLMTLDDC